MVYEPQEDSYLLEKVVRAVVRPGMHVLDMGAGSGIQSFAASESGARTVLAVDCDEEALEYLACEIQKRGTKNIRVKQSDLFHDLSAHDTFDVIIFNAPYLPDDAMDPDVALDGGKEGHELIARFLDEAGKFLSRGGVILLLFSTHSGLPRVMEAIMKNGFVVEELASESLFFEGLYVYGLSKPAS